MTRFAIAFFFVALSVPVQAEQFSIKCIGFPGWIITFDEERKRMISETPGGMMHKGIIESSTEDEVRFHSVLVSPEPVLVWNRKSGVLNRPGEPQDWRNECFRTELRPVMPRYDEILP